MHKSVASGAMLVYASKIYRNSQAACRKENDSVTLLLVCEKEEENLSNTVTSSNTLSFSAHQFNVYYKAITKELFSNY